MIEMMWRSQAACADKPVDLFFPGQGQSSKPAKDICRGCPVQRECLKFAYANEEPGCRHGVYGGLTGTERSLRREWRG